MALTDGRFGSENGGVGGFHMSLLSRFCVLLGVALTFIAATTMAQTQTSTTSQLPPPVDRSGSTEAKKKITTAQSELTRAQAALADVVTKLRTEFEGGQDWQNAAAAHKSA